jgi:hypothetical protein
LLVEQQLLQLAVVLVHTTRRGALEVLVVERQAVVLVD